MTSKKYIRKLKTKSFFFVFSTFFTKLSISYLYTSLLNSFTCKIVSHLELLVKFNFAKIEEVELTDETTLVLEDSSLLETRESEDADSMPKFSHVRKTTVTDPSSGKLGLIGFVILGFCNRSHQQQMHVQPL